eukprot:8194026-Pyramimonas_sp.AAC.1
MSVDPARSKIAVKHRQAEMVCRLQDARAFTGAVFDDISTSVARAGLARDPLEDYPDHIGRDCETRTSGH